MGETHAPSRVRSTMWVEQNVWRRASARVAPAHELVLVTRTVIAREPRPQAPERARPRRRASRHERRILPPGTRCSASPAGTRIGPGPISRSTASSQETQRSSPAIELLHRLQRMRRLQRVRRLQPVRRLQRVHRSAGLQHLALDHVQKANAHLDLRVLLPLEQHLRLHRGPVVPGRRIHAAEREALLVLQRRLAVGPQQITLVEHGVGDPADDVVAHLRSLASRRSTASSSVRSPCSAL